jgi:4-hydroxy-tetrahydrodipicolinate synthase
MPRHRISEQSQGVFVIAATPFDDTGNLDFDSADRLIDHYIACGVAGITVLGMMGEAHKLTRDESVNFARHVLNRCDGRLPIVVGVSQSSLRGLKDLSNEAMESGAAGVMVSPPNGLKTDDEVYSYISAVADTLGPDIPLCLQDYPQATGTHFTVAVVLRLIAEVESFVMFKHEDCPGLTKLSRIRAESEAAGLRRLSIVVGNGGLYYPLELGRGADGAMTGFAYPEMLVEVLRLMTAGDQDAADDLFDAYLPVLRYEQQPGFGLAVRKEILRRRGLIATAHLRRPGAHLSAIDHTELDRLLDRLERRIASHRVGVAPALSQAGD